MEELRDTKGMNVKCAIACLFFAQSPDSSMPFENFED